MCHQIYIATHQPIPQDLTANLTIQVSEVRDEEYSHWPTLHKKFSYPHIYDVSSPTGCSCDLHVKYAFDEVPIPSPPDTLEKETLVALGEFYTLLTTLAHEHPLELYSCWDGDQGEPCGEQLEFDVTTLSYPTFFLPTEERRFFNLFANANG